MNTKLSQQFTGVGSTGCVPVLSHIQVEVLNTKLSQQFTGVGSTGCGATVIVTSAKQDKSEAVHLKTFAPEDNPFTTVFGSVLETNVPVPETTLQVPVAGEVAAKDVLVVAHKA